MQDDIQQLKWRCRRGTRELEMVLGRFVDSTYPGLDTKAKNSFRMLLEQQDTALIEWLVYQQQPAPEFSAIVESILRTD